MGKDEVIGHIEDNNESMKWLVDKSKYVSIRHLQIREIDCKTEYKQIDLTAEQAGELINLLSEWLRWYNNRNDTGECYDE